MEIRSSRMGSGSTIGTIILVILVICCLLTIVGLAIAVGVYRNKLRTCRRIESELKARNMTGLVQPCNCTGTGGTSTYNTCLSSDCAATAGEVISRMDLTADPCDDFYQYACGTYSKAENRPPDQVVVQTFDLPQQRVQQLLYQYLTADGTDYLGTPSTAVQKAKNYFKVCMADTGNDKTGEDLLIKLLDHNPFGTGNLTESYLENALQTVHGLQLDGIMSLGITIDPRNASKYILTLGPASLSLGDQEYYKNRTMEPVYKEYVAKILTLLYGSQENYSEVANLVWSFEAAIANIYPTKSELANPGNANNIAKLGSIKSQISFLNITSLISKEFLSSGVAINDDTEVLLVTPKYFTSLNGVVTGLGMNSSQVVMAYLWWTVVSAMLPYAGNSFQEAHDMFGSKVLGIPSQSIIQWKACLDETVTVAGFAAGAIYTQNQVSDVDRQRVNTILQLSKTEIVARIPQANWLTDTVKARVEANANGLSWQIAFPQYINTTTKLDQYYGDLNVSGNYFQNVIEGRHFQVKRSVLRYGKPVDMTEWKRHPTATYSYYNSATNQVLIQAGLLQKPMYDRNFPLAFAYGGLGSILGQKMMMLYGFQDNWWDAQTVTAYNNKAQCFINQYNKENFMGIPVDGTITSVENIADTEGLKIAYDAYLKSVNNDPDKIDRLLPGLNMTGIQQFFLGFTQLGCFNADPARIREVIQSDHVPSPTRVKLLLQNTPEFAQAFKCADNSRMKLSDSARCSL